MATDNYGNELDLEYVYPPKSERVICAGDERHAALEARVKELESLDGLTAGYLLRAEEDRYAMNLMREEVERLRTKWESVPWQALLWSVSGAASVYAAPAEDINTALDWIRAEAPKEATE